MPKQPNRLIHEKSPYLLQHAHNPVDWFPWGEEAFEKARAENKPVFLSIGYSTCHWCHVMEHESFEDEDVARLMNQAFVSIKVDREERPDVDNIYMTVCQLTTGSGGWPLTIFMTPDKKPFFAGTYIPKHDRFGRAGMMQLIPRIQEVWKQQRDEVERSAEQIASAIQQINAGSFSGQEFNRDDLKAAYLQLYERYDESYGGFGSAPKFPTPHQFSFLLRYWKREQDSKALEIVENTLREMRKGGIYDQLGFGFHRYSTDRYWLVPHFEKMLYDQALLALAYTETYQATRKEEFRKTAEEIFTYVLRDMTDPSGGFYSAEDADSEGVEGKFYLWTPEELEEVLGGEDAAFAAEVFQVKQGGNFFDSVSGGQAEESILHLKRPLPDSGADAERVGKIREKLFAHREARIHPYKDDKVLTDWNGLMIAAFARASAVFNRPEYREAAERAADFLLHSLRQTDGSLLHRYREGEAAITGHLDDYAFLIWGLLELFETSFHNVKYLRIAIELSDYLHQHFWDEPSAGYFLTSDISEQLLMRPKEVYDGAVPSGNSVCMLNLLRLARITGKTEYEQRAVALSRAFAEAVRQNPAAHTQLMIAIDFAIGPSQEIVVVATPDAPDTSRMLQTIRSVFVPNKVLILVPPEDDPEIAKFSEFTRHQKALQGKATAYICRNFVCEQPTTDPEKVRGQLSGEE